LDYNEAEKKKKAEGMQISAGNVRILLPVVDVILLEIRKVLENFRRIEPEEVRKIVLTGGSASMVGLAEYLERQTRLKTEALDPFRDMLYPPILESRLKESGSSYTVAIGMALRGFD
jgi:Tfp pilus assembly PilM family ATPase